MLTYEEQHRFRMIEIILYWEGSLNTSQITSALNIQRNRASTIISQYKKTYPDSLHYDASLKTYLPGTKFQLHHAQDSFSEYVSYLRTYKGGCLDGGFSSHICSLNEPLAPLPITRQIVSAITRREILDVSYASMNSPDQPKYRQIAPHTLIHNGLRWHTRAYCLRNNRFQDFVLGRFLTVTFSGKAPIEMDKSRDTFWTEQVTIKIKPKSDLSLKKRKIIAVEHCMVDDELELSFPKALLLYKLQQFHLSPEWESSPHSHLEIINKGEVGELWSKLGLNSFKTEL